MVSDTPIRIVFLGSGSAGNAAVVSDGTTTVLLDCGFSARDVASRLRRIGIDAATVSAVLLTHEHTDHVRGVDVFARRHAPGCRVLATEGTRSNASVGTLAADIETVRCGEPVTVGSLTVLPFRTSHDAAEPVGYRIDGRSSAVGIVTDTGVITPEAVEALAGVEVLGLESNHDVRMLETGPYPPFLKRRIRSHAGHLSNEDAAAALERLATGTLRRVYALHRSRTNNTATLSRDALASRARALGLRISIEVAEQDSPSDSAPAQASLFGEELA
jgi:phosphoribosyl 1,2-cyclic phosphodiesterase